jgi:serine/threonine protein kinase
MIADQIINNIEYLHFKGYLHRDIKPENFLMGLGKKLSQIFTIDYANATPYLDTVTKEHVPIKDNRKSLYGTIRYVSINTHKGILNSRRDDLEAIGYMLIYFMKGRLPWMDIKSNSLTEKLEKTKQSK